MTRKIGRIMKMGLFVLPLALSGTALAQSAGGGMSGDKTGTGSPSRTGTSPDVEDQRLDNPAGSDKTGLPGSSDARRRSGTSGAYDDMGGHGTAPGTSDSDRLPVSGSDENRGSDVRGGSINDTRTWPQGSSTGSEVDRDNARTEPGTKSHGTPGSMGTTDSTNAPGTRDHRSSGGGSSHHTRDTYNLDRDADPGEKGIRTDGTSGRVGVSGKDEGGDTGAKAGGESGEKKTKKTKKTTKTTETTTETSGGGAKGGTGEKSGTAK